MEFLRVVKCPFVSCQCVAYLMNWGQFHCKPTTASWGVLKNKQTVLQS